MTSQRDETTPRPAGEDVTDDPIVIERHDEILTGEEPAPAGDAAAYDPAAYDPAASDELIGRHEAPDTSGMDPAPLVVPAEPADPDSATFDSATPELGASELGTPGTGAPGSAPFGSEPADPADPDSPATSPASAALDEPGVDEPGIDEPGAAEPVLADRDMDEPVVAETPEPAVSGPAAGATGAGIPAAALSEQQWPAIQAMFVDDPRGSVQRAAAAADEVVKAFVASIEREQAALSTAWEKDATTEDLRTALQQYRAFCGRLEGLA